MITKNKVGLGGVVAMAMLATALFTNLNAFAADVPVKGAQRLMELSKVRDIQAVQAGDVVVMACPKCKTMVETRVEYPPKGAGGVEKKVAVHGCPGCSAKWEVNGHGKAKREKVTHVCSHCGSKSAFCAVKKSAADAK